MTRRMNILGYVFFPVLFIGGLAIGLLLRGVGESQYERSKR